MSTFLQSLVPVVDQVANIVSKGVGYRSARVPTGKLAKSMLGRLILNKEKREVRNGRQLSPLVLSVNLLERRGKAS